MKALKYFIFLSLHVAIPLMMASCNFPPQLSPPSWIIGTWEDQNKIAIWTFTSDDAVWTSGSTTIDFKKMQGPGVTVSDSETATTYAVSMGTGGITQTYSFEKGDGSYINWTSMATKLYKK